MSENLKDFISKCFEGVAMDTEHLCQKLTDLGVESMDDLQFLNEADLPFMKPVHLRKFLSKVKGHVGNKTGGQGSTSTIKDTIQVQPLQKPLGSYQSSESTWSKFSVKTVFARMPELVTDIDSNKRPNPDTRRKFVRELVDEVRKISNNITKKEFEIIAQKTVSSYPAAFEDRIGAVRVGTGHDSLLKQLIARNENVNRSPQPKKTVLNEPCDKDGESAPASKKRLLCQKDMYGCVNWGPKLNGRESTEQEEMKKQLQDMYSEKDTEDWDKIYKLMKGVYGLLRKDINDGKPLPELLEQWPYLVQGNVLLEHCELLLGLDVRGSIESAYLQKAPILLRFFKSKQSIIGTSDYLASLEIEKSSDNYQAILQGVILCIQKCVGEEEQSLMFPVNEMSSNEEIESENKESWPRLAMLGASTLSATEFALVVDKHVMGRYTSYLNAISLLFGTYYAFNIEYPCQAAASLEFIQRCFVGINPDKGIKTSGRRRSSNVNAKVLTLINQIADFQWTG